MESSLKIVKTGTLKLINSSFELVKIEDNSPQSSTNDEYCRCCFHFFKKSENKIQINQQFQEMVKELFKTGMQFNNGSQSICDSCNDSVEYFWKFKQDFFDKQAKFLCLIIDGDLKDLNKIRELSDLPNVIEQENEMEEDIFKRHEEIKAEPLEPLTVTTLNIPSNEPAELLLIEEQPTPRKIKRTKKKCAAVKQKITTVPVKPKKQICQDCKSKFLDLPLHRYRKHGIKVLFRCQICKFATRDKEEFDQHKRISHKPPQLPKIREDRKKTSCPICKKRIRIGHIKTHIANIHNREKNFFCDLCIYSSFEKRALEEHMMTYHMPKIIKCPKCDYTTINQIRLKGHIKNRHEERLETSAPTKFMICTIKNCNKTFKTEASLALHQMRIHKKGDPKYPCKFNGCQRLFHAKIDARHHFNRIHAEKNLICDACGLGFATGSALRSHFKLAHAEREILCEYCNKRFANEYGLKDHIKRNHTFEKDFKCTQCDAAYYESRRLDHHVLIKHMGIRFNCGVPGCKSSLSRRDAYWTHLKSHKELTKEELKELHVKLDEFCVANNIIRG